MPNAFYSFCGIALVGAFLSGASAATEPVITVHEPLDRNWPPEWVSWPLELPVGSFHPGQVVPVDSFGRPAEGALQVHRLHDDGSVRSATAYVYTGLQPNETRTFHLRRGPERRPQLTVHKESENRAVIASDRIRIRTVCGSGAPGQLTEGGGLAGPIIAVAAPGGGWMAAGQFHDTPETIRFQTRTDDRLPHQLVHEIRYRLGDSEYRVRLTLIAHEPAVLVEEDFKEVSTGEWVLSFAPGLQPTMGHGRFHRPTGPKKEGGPDGYRIDYRIEDGCQLQPFYAWWADFSTWWAAYRPEGDYLGLFTTGPAEWLNPKANRIRIRTAPPDVVEARFPLHNGTRRWGLVLAPADQALERSLAGGNLVQRTMIRLCENPLDAVKGLPLTWPGSDNIENPHLLCGPEDVPHVREKARTWPEPARVLERTPEAPADPAGLYLATGDETQAAKARENLLKQLRTWVAQALEGDGYLNGALVAITFTRPLRRAAVVYDLIASSESMSGTQRDYCLRAFAFLAHCLADPNRWPPRGQGFHRGNVNFHSDDYTCRAAVTALLVGHPKQKEWMGYVEREMSREFKDCVFPGGAWCEAPNYQAYTVHYLLIAMKIMQRNGFADFTGNEQFRATMDYLFRIQTPLDVRAGIHLLPSVGDTTSHYHSQSLQNTFAWSANLFRDDPVLAGRLMHAWRRGGSIIFGAHGLGPGAGWTEPLLLIDPTIPSVPPAQPLASEQLPGYGAVFRNNHDTDRESYFLYKMGPVGQHFDADEGSFHWYALGVPLSIDFGCMYEPSIEQPWLHSTLDFDRHRIWNQGDVTAFASFDEFDFCSSRARPHYFQKIADLPEQSEGTGPQFRRNECIDWRRDLLFVKGPDYVVIRDDVEDPVDGMSSGWTLQVLASEAAVAAPQARFVGQHGVDVAVLLAEPPTAELTTSTWGHDGKPAPQWVSEHPMPPMAETQIALHTTAPVDGDYLAVMAPFPHGSAPPVLSSPGPGIVQVGNHDLEDTIVFLPATEKIDLAGASFNGRVGLIRQAAGERVAFIAEGSSVRMESGEFVIPGPAVVRALAEHWTILTRGSARRASVRLLDLSRRVGQITLDDHQIAGLSVGKSSAGFDIPAGAHKIDVHLN